MNPTSPAGSTPQAVDRLGMPVPTPSGVDPARWALLTRQVLVIPGGCHIWTGRPRKRDGYGQFWTEPGDLTVEPIEEAVPMLPGLDDLDPVEGQDQQAPPRIWRAHRFAYIVITGQWITPAQQLLHTCDQPLCVRITTEHLDQHITTGTNRDNAHDRDQKNRTMTPGRIGGTAWSTRGPTDPVDRSMTIHEALARGLTAGQTRAQLAVTIADADTAANTFAHPTLF